MVFQFLQFEKVSHGVAVEEGLRTGAPVNVCVQTDTHTHTHTHSTDLFIMLSIKPKRRLPPNQYNLPCRTTGDLHTVLVEIHWESPSCSLCGV